MANYKPPAKPFVTGNKFYKMATGNGRPKQFETPDLLWEAACTYFDYVTDNPVPYYALTRAGKLRLKYKTRPMSLSGLCLYLGICNLKYYKKLEGFSEITERINDVIYEHNFIYTAAGLLKTRIMTRVIFNRYK